MKGFFGALLALILLCSSALADIETTSSVNLRSGPGKNYKVIAKVKKGTVLTDLDSMMTDKNGGNWYWVSYKGKECWVSADFAVITGSEFEAQGGADGAALEAYCGGDIAAAVSALGLGESEYLGGEWEYCHFNDAIYFYSTNERVVGIGLNVPETGGDYAHSYSVYGARLGMKTQDAIDACVERGLYMDSDSYSTVYLYRDPETELDSKELVELRHDDEGLVYQISWSYALEDE